MSNMKFLVSVIVPVYNEEKSIEKCIQSLLNQTFNNFEIICINDGSTDNSLNLLQKYKKRIKIWSITHKGMSTARNIGSKLAKGQILVFLDGDMTFDKNYISEIIKPILNLNKLGTYSSSEYVANYNNIWARCWNINMGINNNRRITNKINSEGTTFRAIKKENFKKIGGFKTNLGYFDDLSLSEKFGFSFPVSNAICYHYNPDTLLDVFTSARWIGRAPLFNCTIINIIRYSFINSIRNSITKIKQGAPFQYYIFKLIFDFGILTGLFNKNRSNNYAK